MIFCNVITLCFINNEPSTLPPQLKAINNSALGIGTPTSAYLRKIFNKLFPELCRYVYSLGI